MQEIPSEPEEDFDADDDEDKLSGIPSYVKARVGISRDWCGSGSSQFNFI